MGQSEWVKGLVIFAFMMLIKAGVFITRAKVSPFAAYPYPEALDLVEWGELPEQVRTETESLCAELESVGMHRTLCRHAPALGQGEGYLLCYLSPDGTVQGNVSWNSFLVSASLVSVGQDGVVYGTNRDVTTTQPLNTEAFPANHQVHSLPESTSMEEMYNQHCNGLAEVGMTLS